ncbi:ABC transporter substrate-binding protein [bacterium]|nr:ABC transporter substrate-binding protein [candidate division CSSED10-310 bacterium]
MKVTQSAQMRITLILLILVSSVIQSLGCNNHVAEKTTHQKPERIISLAPNITEILFAIGAGDRIVAVSNFDVFPPSVDNLPKIGGYMNPDIESIIQLKPDIVITLEGRWDFAERLNQLGIECWTLKIETYEQILDAISVLGNKMDHEEKAGELVSSIRSEISELALSHGKKPRTIVVVGSTPGLLSNIYVAGKGSFINDLIEFTGGINVYADMNSAYVETSTEQIIARQPDIIIECLPGYNLDPDDIEARKQSWQKLGNFPAANHARIYILTDDFILIPGPRITVTAHYFADIITDFGIDTK